MNWRIRYKSDEELAPWKYFKKQLDVEVLLEGCPNEGEGSCWFKYELELRTCRSPSKSAKGPSILGTLLEKCVFLGATRWRLSLSCTPMPSLSDGRSAPLISS